MRLFLCFETPRLDELQSRVRNLGVHASYPKEFHCTLAFWGGEEPRKIIDALQGYSFKPFECVLKGTGFFPHERRPRVFWAGIESGGLLEVYEDLVERLGLEPGFTPHLTIARIKSGKNVEALRALARETQEKEWARFTVSELLLKKSVSTPNQGHEHETIFCVNACES
ncbi:RNA 2',3'-cyclic phosphodiesterase [Candidatus Micrarchaeota archaeon CG09_land_8_20_14_0_10_55_25]|nr:MAG: RNA 2',3'-cyclic phosphodiesterase [Candidatus Micrarchaeota archaeon CG09_land_8_20_14_0_10_55_25]